MSKTKACPGCGDEINAYAISCNCGWGRAVVVQQTKYAPTQPSVAPKSYRQTTEAEMRDLHRYENCQHQGCKDFAQAVFGDKKLCTFHELHYFAENKYGKSFLYSENVRIQKGELSRLARNAFGRMMVAGDDK